MLRKSERLNQFKNFKNLPLLKYGLYVEIDHKYHGYLTDIDGDYIIVSNGIEKSPFHPTWETVYYDNPIDKNIIYDFRSEK